MGLYIALIVGSIILGGFYYATQVSKQKSIERQQQVELEAKKIEVDTKAAQDKKEYTAKRKIDCYSIYEREHKLWNNVVGSDYNETTDKCYVLYKSDKAAKSEAECKKFLDAAFGTNQSLNALMMNQYTDCQSNQFRNEF